MFGVHRLSTSSFGSPQAASRLKFRGTTKKYVWLTNRTAALRALTNLERHRTDQGQALATA